jgi:ATP-dependent RNA helicase DeaD
MELHELANVLGEKLVRAIEQRGYTSLTPVQEAVLAPEHAGRDLRVSSQTGSGKTVALGLAIREVVMGDASPEGTHARPRALVLVPTRELAKQVHEELSWLFAPLGLKVATVTGGAGYRDELRSFRAGPAIVVGTPGRLRDHLERGSLVTSNVGAIVLDEADRMLDFGFREEIEAVVAKLPEDKRVHLVSATFPREVKAFADRVQRQPAIVMGTPLGAANADIEHVVHLVHPRERLDAIVNLLLSDRSAQTLIFAHTRADVADLGAALADIGFTVGTLSGEMEQAERNRALQAFKRGTLDAMVATDVAARGIDVADVSRVIHADPPTDPDAYTHRSGRTGRAGRKGTSSVLVTPPSLVRVLRTLERARVQWKMDPIPSADAILAAQEERMVQELTGASVPEGTDPVEAAKAADVPLRLLSLAERLMKEGDAVRIVARLIARVRAGGPTPRRVTAIAPPAERRRDGFSRDRDDSPRDRGPSSFEGRDRGPSSFEGRDQDGPPGRRQMTSGDPSFRPFRISWGTMQGADARRLLAVVCRRGNIRGADVGAIRLAPTFAVVEVKADVAESFERSASEPDPRAPRVSIRPWSDDAGARPAREASEPREAPRRAAAVDAADEAESIPAERPSRAKRAAPDAEEIPADRPSRAKRAAPDTEEIPADRPSRAKRAAAPDAEEIPADRPSRAKRAAPEEAPAASPRAPREDRPAPRHGSGDRPAPRGPGGDRPAPRYGSGDRPAPRGPRDDRPAPRYGGGDRPAPRGPGGAAPERNRYGTGPQRGGPPPRTERPAPAPAAPRDRGNVRIVRGPGRIEDPAGERRPKRK